MVDNATAGATPVAAGATPAQSTPVSPAAAPAAAAPATGDPEALGDPGKKALDAERKRAEDAEKANKALSKQLEELQAASKSESEKALDAARKEGATEATTRWQNQVRRSEVRAALTAAGINAGVVDLAMKADDFASLAVSDEGEVAGLDAAVEAFKKTRPSLFAAPVAPNSGSFDTGLGGGRATGAGRVFTRQQLRDPAFYAANKDDIMAAAREGRISN